ncbi:MAG: glycosyltransferase family 4 protein [Muribaculaceae bacterium]|nr:glycosyltransferase family 4 protein [Muribaculaceae bacterium]
MRDRKLLIVVNEDRFFLSHRKEVGVRARAAGWDVTVVAKDTGVKGEIEALGLNFVDLPINPTGKNPLQEMRVVRFLSNLYKKNSDAIVHHVGLKLLLWGSLASKMSPVRGTVNALSGLGTLFTGERPSRLIYLMYPLLRFCKRRSKNIHYIFQNNDDRQVFEDQKLLGIDDNHLIRGAGIDLEKFAYRPIRHGGTVKVVFTGRMLEEKGVLDLVKAAEILRPKYEGKVEFILCGALSKNPSALSEKEIRELTDGRYIKWLGYLPDVRNVLVDSTIYCLPSHREGFPKSVIEASAIGRPIVTYNSVGCRDTVEQGKNGFKVPLRDYKSLAESLDMLISDPALCDRMGMASRKIAEKTYDINFVVGKHLQIYDRLYRNSKES